MTAYNDAPESEGPLGTTDQNQNTRRQIVPTRYAVCVEMPNGNEEIATDTNQAVAIAIAKKYHEIHPDQKCWVWNLKQGTTVFRLERASAAGGGR